MPWWPYLADRRMLAMSALRLASITVVLVANATVGLPGFLVPVDMQYFLPLAFAVPMAVTLPERLGWLAAGVARRRLVDLRGIVNGTSEWLVVVVTVVLVLAMRHPHELFGAALLTSAIAYLWAIRRPDTAWLGAAAVGSVMLLPTPGGILPLAAWVPAPIGLAAWLAAIVACTFWLRARPAD